MSLWSSAKHYVNVNNETANVHHVNDAIEGCICEFTQFYCCCQRPFSWASPQYIEAVYAGKQGH